MNTRANYFNSVQSQNNKSTNYQTNALKQDTFVKSKAPSFGNALRFSEKFAPYVEEVRQYILQSPEVKLSELEKIMKKYSPTTLVKDMRDLPKGTNAQQQTKAYFSNRFGFTHTGEVIKQPKEIYITPPSPNDKNERLTFLLDFAHESTHIFQEESLDRISRIGFLENYLKGKPLNEYVISTLNSMFQTFNIVEMPIIEPFYKALNRTDRLPHPMMPIEPKVVLKEIYKSSTGATLPDFIDRVINAGLSHMESRVGRFDKKSTKEFLSLIADKEREAHENAMNVVKKELNMNGQTDLDLRVSLYKTMVERAKA